MVRAWWLVLAVLGLGCGGSSSETPFAQSPSEVAAIPVLQRPQQRPTKRDPAPRGASPSLAPPSSSAMGDPGGF